MFDATDDDEEITAVKGRKGLVECPGFEREKAKRIFIFEQ